MSDRYKEKYVSKNRLDLKNRYNSKKEKDEIQRNKKQDIRMIKGFKESIRNNI